MKKLGEGWQYAAYDLGNGRVLKKFHPFLKRCIVICGSLVSGHVRLRDVFRFAQGLREKAVASLAFVKSGVVSPEMLGHPLFTSGLDYEQDKVMPMHSYLAEATEEQGRGAIDSFVAFTSALAARGVIDKSFNIGKNFGLSADGNVVLLDIGELLFDDAKVVAQLARRPWTKPYVLEAVPGREHAYFVRRMDEEFL